VAGCVCTLQFADAPIAHACWLIVATQELEVRVKARRPGLLYVCGPDAPQAGPVPAALAAISDEKVNLQLREYPLCETLLMMAQRHRFSFACDRNLDPGATVTCQLTALAVPVAAWVIAASSGCTLDAVESGTDKPAVYARPRDAAAPGEMPAYLRALDGGDQRVDLQLRDYPLTDSFNSLAGHYVFNLVANQAANDNRNLTVLANRMPLSRATWLMLCAGGATLDALRASDDAPASATVYVLRPVDAPATPAFDADKWARVTSTSGRLICKREGDAPKGGLRDLLTGLCKAGDLDLVWESKADQAAVVQLHNVSAALALHAVLASHQELHGSLQAADETVRPKLAIREE
ncbi:MAG: hypothetical protein AB7S36_23375, partial [Planctomycetota bacterium]